MAADGQTELALGETRMFPVDNNAVEYIFAILLGPVREAPTFGAWPPHITVIPWFGIDSYEAALASAQAVAIMVQAFDVTIGGMDMFGPRQNVPVLTIESFELEALHDLLAGGLENAGAEFYAPQYMFGNYHPHITMRRSRFVPNDSRRVDRLWLIEAKSHEPRLKRRKTIRAEIEFAQ